MDYRARNIRMLLPGGNLNNPNHHTNANNNNNNDHHHSGAAAGLNMANDNDDDDDDEDASFAAEATAATTGPVATTATTTRTPPRQYSNIWDHVQCIKHQDGNVEQICRYCQLTKRSFQCQASHWAVHLVDKCIMVPANVRLQVYMDKRDSVTAVRNAGMKRGFDKQVPSRSAATSTTTNINTTNTNNNGNADHNASPLSKKRRKSESAEDSQGLISTNTTTTKTSMGHKAAAGGGSAGVTHVTTAGRPSSHIWDHVDRFKDDHTNKWTMTCKYCQMRKSSTQLLASKFALHLVDECTAFIPESVRLSIWLQKKDSVKGVLEAGIRRGFSEADAQRLVVDTSSLLDKVAVVDRSAIGSNKNPMNNKRPRTSMHDSLAAGKAPGKRHAAAAMTGGGITVGGDYCDDARADKITLAVMEFIAGCAVSVMVVQSRFFIKMLRSMNEAYVHRYLPKARVFTNIWLPKLKESVNTQLETQWKTEKESYVSLCSDNFQNNDGKKVLVLTEARLDKVAFRDIVVEGDERHVSTVISQVWMDKMTISAGGSLEKISDSFAAVCAESTRTNLAAGKIIEEKFPKIFFNACRCHCGYNLCQDIASLTQFEMLVKNVRTVVNFVRSNERIKAAYTKRMPSLGGTMLVPFPEKVRFAFMDKMFEAILGPEEQNIEILNALITDPEWDTLVEGISPWNVAEFVALIHDAEFFNRVKCIRGLSKPLSIFMHHMERPAARASWLIPAFEALEKDLFVWCDDTITGEFFNEETISGIKKSFERHWKGESEGMMYSPQYLLAMLLDPATTMSVDELNQAHPDWYQECRKVLSRFFGEKDMIIAKTQLHELVSQTGQWGDEVAESQAFVTIEPKQHRFHVQTVAEEQQKGCDLKPHLLWKVAVGRQFPELKEIAIRLLTMATQAADVERVCEVQKIVSTKVCDRLKNLKVKDLVYCYVNLRLLKTRTASRGEEDGDDNVFEDFLCDAILEEEGQGGDDAEASNKIEAGKEDSNAVGSPMDL